MRAIANKCQPCPNPRLFRVKIKLKRDIRHQPIGRRIVRAADDGRSGGSGLGVEHRLDVGPLAAQAKR